MRFELGDKLIENEGQAAALCDEEYQALIHKAKDSGGKNTWRAAKMACLEAILMQYAHETNYSADGMSISLNDRYKRFKDLLDQLKSAVQVPSVSPQALGICAANGGHYFRLGMHDHPGLLTEGRR